MSDPVSPDVAAYAMRAETVADIGRSVNASLTNPCPWAANRYKLRELFNFEKMEFCDAVRSMLESVMSEAEFDRMLDAVNAAVAPVPQEDFVSGFMKLDHAVEAANDNGTAWPLIPFPDGWHAAC